MGNVCRMNSCCWVCSLRTGSLIIAFLDLICAFTVLTYAIVVVTVIGHAEDRIRNRIADYWDWSYGQNKIINESQEEFILRGALYFLSAMSSIVIVSDFAIFFGILRGGIKWVSTSVGLAFITVFIAFAVILGIIFHCTTGNKPSIEYWKIFLFAFIYLGFKVYFVMVIRSYAYSLMEGNNFHNGVNLSVYSSTLTNGQQPFYPNVNVQQAVYSNGHIPNPSEQQQMYPNRQTPYSSAQQQIIPNEPPPYSSGEQRMYPNGQQAFPSVQQTYPNSQVPAPREQPPPYPNGQPEMPVPPINNRNEKRFLK